jgi:Ca-activated chloride channel family protein
LAVKIGGMGESWSRRGRSGGLLALLATGACLTMAEPAAAPETEPSSRADAVAVKPRTTVRRPPTKAATAASSTSKEPTAESTRPVLPPAALTETYFKHYGINPTIDTEEEAFSSFALDVDTASYALARAALERGEMPDESAIRIEEFLNAFDYDYPTPSGGDFAVFTEVVPSPHRPGYHVLQVGLQAREIADKDRAPANLVFVIDVSSSMALESRLQLVQDALTAMLARMGPRDRIAIVSYGTTAEVVLEPTPGDRHDAIAEAIAKLAPRGSTDVDAGLRLGYTLATKSLVAGGINRVLLFSDGVVTSGPDAAEELLAHVAEAAARGVTISTMGVGVDNYDDVLLEQLADRGNGNYVYIDRLAEAERVLVRNLSGTLQVVARDAKIQVEFDPKIVARYRLLGYENRGLSTDAFANDSTDAGEIGPGHSVTALYEVQLRDDLAAFGKVRLRYLLPYTSLPRTLELPLVLDGVRPLDARGSPPVRVALVVAALAEKLRGSYWIRDVAWADIQRWFAELPPDVTARPEVAELGEMIDAAARQDRRNPNPDREFAGSPLEFDRMPVLQ